VDKKWQYRFKLGVVMEEIHRDPEMALPFARQLGMTHVEFGSLWGRPLPETTPEDWARMAALLEDNELEVAMVGPSTFKTVYIGHLRPDEVERDAHFLTELAAMEKVLRAAQYFKAPLARTFSFRREGIVGLGNPSARLPRGGEIADDMLDRLRAAFAPICRLADDAGVDLGLENVRSCWGNSGWNAARIIEAAGSSRLKSVWDPANGFVSGEDRPYPDGYLEVLPYIAHVHVKDAVVLDPSTGLTEWQRIGDGAVDYLGQMRALIDDGFEGVVSVETHYEPEGKTPAEATRLTTEGLLQVLHSVSSASGCCGGVR